MFLTAVAEFSSRESESDGAIAFNYGLFSAVERPKISERELLRCVA